MRVSSTYDEPAARSATPDGVAGSAAVRVSSTFDQPGVPSATLHGVAGSASWSPDGGWLVLPIWSVGQGRVDLRPEPRPSPVA